MSRVARRLMEIGFQALKEREEMLTVSGLRLVEETKEQVRKAQAAIERLLESEQGETQGDQSSRFKRLRVMRAALKEMREELDGLWS